MGEGLSKSNDKKLNIKKSIKQIRQDEKVAILKAERDTRLAIKQAADIKEQQILNARDIEIRTLREVKEQSDNSIKAMRENNRKGLELIKKTRDDAITEARTSGKNRIREAYDEETVLINGVDKKTARRIKQITAKKIEQARNDTERAVNDALFEEKHATRKALDVAYRDIVKEEEKQKIIRSRTAIDARNKHLKAIEDADLQYKNAVDDISKHYKATIENIKNKADEAIMNLKDGGRLPESTEIREPLSLAENMDESEDSVREYDNPVNMEQPSQVEVVDKAEKELPESSADEVYQTTEENEVVEESELDNELEEAIDVEKLSETDDKDKSGEPTPVEELAVVTAYDDVSISEKDDTVASIAEPEESESLMYKGIVKINIKKPVAPHRINMFAEQLNEIDKIRTLFIGGEANKDTVIHLKIDEDMPIVNILKTLPYVDGVYLKDKIIQLTFADDKE